ncbi:DNA polymerase III subunit delta [Formosa sp. Hel3_A1_48]|mgnify:CR=1 FL=1|jgi:DNA polymerase-3 subunit delta|uniref:DNA polymerase III subunit delta n=1 Tax=Formosa sp. Hel3_A1_48 TaxID=1336795 RepID=UPI00084E149E|nr:DNA polymerase III subunit delta [Formosa sp. Hel3_A1_48]AOR25285.1 DNA polymerase III subunit delta [Formosa sp. Hel3_A1_48]MDC0950365.1 DNA polymerase III subunit delta [Flavobacteriaceae bacterium]MDC3275094.1 DNA polymerase III subunit delta [Flavobacteriaceae bacterium]|tara:strand:- start:1300 stop:2301 length:1002 start_codon:yes stop_codon:yes gene_type:complete
MHTVQSILNEIKAGDIRPLYFLMGEEAFFIDQISTFIETSVLDETQRGFDQTTIYGKDTSIDAIVSSAKRFPMLAERQVIVVKEAQNLSRTIEDLLPYVKNPQHTTTLVICYKYKSIDKRKALYKALSKAHVVFESKKIYDSKIPSWISGELQKMNLKITPKASYLLSEFLGNDLAKISNELSKLQLVMGDNDLITPELIQINIGISKDFNNFELQKAIAQLDQKKAYQIVRYFSENPNQHPMVLTVATLYSFFSKLMILHTVNDRNPKVLSRAIGVNPYFLNDYTAAAKNFPMRRISSVFQTLRTIDVKSKGVGANLKPLDLYQELIFRILS